MHTLLSILLSLLPISDSTSIDSTYITTDTTCLAMVEDSACVTDSIEIVPPLVVERIDSTPDSLFIQRLQALPYVVELPYNQIVRRYILRYLQHSPKQVAALQRRQEKYMATFHNILSQYNLPYELAYLPIIESALNPNARSHMGAVGLWQFMPATGKKYGLEINSLVDERRDPIKSTHSAARFLNALYNVFHDWNLVIAAYNCGPGNVNKAISRAGGKRDFWSIYPYLPKETRAYLPLYIAAVYVMNYADLHGIVNTDPEALMTTDSLAYNDSIIALDPQQLALCEASIVDTIVTEERLHLLQIAECIHIPLEQLRELNPQYTRDIVPGAKAYAICLPIEKVDDYIAQTDTILKHRANELIHNRRTEINLLQQTSVNGAYSVNGVTYYKIKDGDTLGGIAAKFRVSVKQLKQWNQLTSDFIRAGKTLKILN